MLLITKFLAKRDGHIPMTRAQYRRFLTWWWAYTLIWVGMLLVVAFFPGVSDTLRWILGAALVVITPSGGGHFTSYSAYLLEFESEQAQARDAAANSLPDRRP